MNFAWEQVGTKWLRQTLATFEARAHHRIEGVLVGDDQSIGRLPVEIAVKVAARQLRRQVVGERALAEPGSPTITFSIPRTIRPRQAQRTDAG